MDKHNAIKNAFELIEELDELIEIEYMEADDDFGYDHVHDFYEVDEQEVYYDYDTTNIDNWPVCGY